MDRKPSWTRLDTGFAGPGLRLRDGLERMKGQMDMALATYSRRAPVRASLPAKTWILALLDGTSAVGLAAMAAAPLGGNPPSMIYAASASALALVAALLLTFGERIGSRQRSQSEPVSPGASCIKAAVPM